jgi:two-component system sensor histidine kinase TctE
MSLRTRLFLWLLLALAVLLVPLGVLTVQEARRTAERTLELAARLRLGALQAQGGGLRELAQSVNEFGGVGFVLQEGRPVYTDQGSYQLPPGLLEALIQDKGVRLVEKNTLWIARGQMGLGIPLTEVATLPQRLLSQYLWVGGALLVLAFGIGAIGLSQSLSPLNKVAADLSGRNPEHLEPLELPLLPEAHPPVLAINQLMQELDTALGRLKLQEQAAKRFAYGASHELRNPLAALKGYLEVLQRRPAEERAIAGALREALRMEDLLGSLLTLARLEGTGKAEVEELDLARFLQQMNLEVEGSGRVLAEPALLKLAVINLGKNAEKHGGGLARFVLEVDRRGVWLWAYDRGPGFPPEVLPKAFEPFVKQGDGTGLGLAIVGAVAGVLEGIARAENLAQGGARVGIWLPSE